MKPPVVEAWPRGWRHAYIRELHQRGLDDAAIAERTSLTTYTAARIRRSLGLAPNPIPGGATSWRGSRSTTA